MLSRKFAFRSLRHVTSRRQAVRRLATREPRKARQHARSVAAFACSTVAATAAAPVFCNGGDGDASDGSGTTLVLGLAAALAGGALYLAFQPTDGASDTGVEEVAVEDNSKTETMLESAQRQGNFVRVEKILIELLKSQREKNDPAEIDTLCKLAVVQLRNGRSNDALDTLERSVQLKKGAEPPNAESKELCQTERLAVQWILRNLGGGGTAEHAGRSYLRCAQEREKQRNILGAVEAYGRALAVASFCQSNGNGLADNSSPQGANPGATSGGKDFDTRAIMDNIGRLLHDSSSLKEVPKAQVAALFNVGLKALGVALGWMHPDVALALRDSAMKQFNAGDADRAFKQLQQALAIQEDVLGPTDLQKAETLNQLGQFMLFVRKDPRGAMRAFDEASTIFTLELGNGHPRAEGARRLLEKARDECYK